MDDITRAYFDRLEEIRFDRDESEDIPVGKIIIQFHPDYDYPIADFTDLEEGEEKFKIINDFINKYK